MNVMDFDALVGRGTVLLDGAMGSQLRLRGMPVGVCTELWAAEHPDVVLALQRALGHLHDGTVPAPGLWLRSIVHHRY